LSNHAKRLIQFDTELAFFNANNIILSTRSIIMKRISFIFALLCISHFASAQVHITSIETNITGDFHEFTIHTSDEDVEGSLLAPWFLLNGDLTDWDYRVGEEFGKIKLKWKQNPNEWELRGDGNIVTIRTLFPNDFTQWKIDDGDISVVIKTKYANIPEEWLLRQADYGEYFIYTEWEGDPNVWTIEDFMDEDLSIHFRMAMAFAVVYNGTPKE